MKDKSTRIPKIEKVLVSTLQRSINSINEVKGLTIRGITLPPPEIPHNDNFTREISMQIQAF